MNIYLIFSEFISRPTSLLVADGVSVVKNLLFETILNRKYVRQALMQDLFKHILVVLIVD
jgi:hypothetical protein